MSWIKIRTKLKDDGRLLITTRKCNASSVTCVTQEYVTCNAVLGALVTLWSYADDHADENGVLFGWTAETVNQKIGINNFAESLPECWIDLTGEWVKLPEYKEHNGSTAKSRAQTAKRVCESRKRNAPIVTKVTQEPLPEKIREDKKRRDKKEEPLTPLQGNFDLASHINTKEVQEIILSWLQYKKEKGQKYKPTGLKSLIKKLGDDYKDPENLIKSIEDSMSKNYAGIFKTKDGLDRARKHLSRNDQHHEAIRTSMERVQKMREEIAEEERTGISSGEQFGFFGGFLDMPEKE